MIEAGWGKSRGAVSDGLGKDGYRGAPAQERVELEMTELSITWVNAPLYHWKLHFAFHVSLQRSAAA